MESTQIVFDGRPNMKAKPPKNPKAEELAFVARK